MQRWVRFSFLVLLIGMLGADRLAVAQGRLSDKDLQRLMQNLKDDAQPFRQSFANALKKSTIRKTSQEKDARALADTFAKQANGALETFKHDQKADQAVAALVNTAARIDPLVYSLQLNPQTTSQWEKLRSELHQIAQAFGVPEPYFAPQPGSSSAAPSSYWNVPECCGYRAVAAAGERMPAGFTRDPPALQCTERMLADRRRDQAGLRAHRSGRTRVLRGVPVEGPGFQP